jgi:hypothetical protein
MYTVIQSSLFKNILDIYLQSQLRVFFMFIITSFHYMFRPLRACGQLSVATAGIYLKDFYVYVAQQDAPHKDKIHSSLLFTIYFIIFYVVCCFAFLIYDFFHITVAGNLTNDLG